MIIITTIMIICCYSVWPVLLQSALNSDEALKKSLHYAKNLYNIMTV